MSSGKYILANEATHFSQEFIEYLGGNIGCVTLNSGFDGLQLTLRALGVGAGDEVIVPSNAPIPVWMSVSITGAKPVPVEPDMSTYNLVYDRGITRISPKVKAIILVYLYGRPIDHVSELYDECKQRGIYLIEDCSQAHGAIVDSVRKAGTIGDAGVFSFYPTKNMGAYGDAGAVVSRSVAVTSKIAIMRYYGEGSSIGINSRMDSLQAAFLRVRLGWLDFLNEQRRENAKRYLKELRGIPGLTLPLSHPGHVWHQFVIRHPERDALKNHLSRNGVETLVHYDQSANKMKYYSGYPSCPNAEALAKTVLSLPVGPHLSEEDLDCIIETIKAYK